MFTNHIDVKSEYIKGTIRHNPLDEVKEYKLYSSLMISDAFGSAYHTSEKLRDIAKELNIVADKLDEMNK